MFRIFCYKCEPLPSLSSHLGSATCLAFIRFFILMYFNMLNYGFAFSRKIMKFSFEM